MSDREPISKHYNVHHSDEDLTAFYLEFIARRDMDGIRSANMWVAELKLTKEETLLVNEMVLRETFNITIH